MKKKSIVVIGGGTGTYTVLIGLKKYPLNLAAIVTMSDDGGSSGILRDELGVLPAGDVRQCLVALSTSDRLMRDLMNYRFAQGSLKGHTFGNIFLSALEKVTGSFDNAVEEASEILRLEGKVLPSTLDTVRLAARFHDGRKIEGQRFLHTTDLKGLDFLCLVPEAHANPKALKALKESDVIIIGPGDFYQSLVPNLLVKGLREAICKSKAKKIFICNLMTKKGHTQGWRAEDFTRYMENYLRCHFDFVVYNNVKPKQELVKRYAREGEFAVEWGNLGKRFKGANLMTKKFPKQQAEDQIKRSLIRHDPDVLARHILRICGMI